MIPVCVEAKARWAANMEHDILHGFPSIEWEQANIEMQNNAFILTEALQKIRVDNNITERFKHDK